MKQNLILRISVLVKKSTNISVEYINIDLLIQNKGETKESFENISKIY